jgi:glyoxylase-like metal-dependent hydrolase (beta-lactamase superfamily II)
VRALASSSTSKLQPSIAVVGRTAWERAESPHLRDRASFIRELPGLLAGTGRLNIADTGTDARRLLGDAFEFVETNGHTPGMLHTRVRGSPCSALFAADLVPGRPWVHLPIPMGYDRYPALLCYELRTLH